MKKENLKLLLDLTDPGIIADNMPKEDLEESLPILAEKMGINKLAEIVESDIIDNNFEFFLKNNVDPHILGRKISTMIAKRKLDLFTKYHIDINIIFEGKNIEDLLPDMKTLLEHGLSPNRFLSGDYVKEVMASMDILLPYHPDINFFVKNMTKDNALDNIKDLLKLKADVNLFVEKMDYPSEVIHWFDLLVEYDADTNLIAKILNSET